MTYGYNTLAGQLLKVAFERRALFARQVLVGQQPTLARRHHQAVVVARALGHKRHIERSVVTHTDRHRALTAIEEYNRMLQTLSAQAEDHLALEFVGHVAEDHVISRIRVETSLDQHLVVALDSLRHNKRLRFDHTVMISTLGGDRYGEVVAATLELEMSARNTVGRQQQRQTIDVGANLEVLNLLSLRRAQNLDSEACISQANQICTHRRNEQSSVVPLRELHSVHSVPIYTTYHR